jgi:hypothetical protein
MEPMKHDPDYPPRAWVQPFVDWATAPNGTRTLDFKGAEVPPTLQQLLINGLPGMSSEFGPAKAKRDPIEVISGVLAAIVMAAVALSLLAGGIALVKWAL